MKNKNLEDKAIDFKGKKYVLVSDRVLFFNETYPLGSIETSLISLPSDEMVVMKATVTPDTKNPVQKFTGYSQAKWGDGYINKSSAIENAETSAVGRALGMMGIGVIESIASVDEINKAQAHTGFVPKSRTPIYKQKDTFINAKSSAESDIALDELNAALNSER